MTRKLMRLRLHRAQTDAAGFIKLQALRLRTLGVSRPRPNQTPSPGSIG